MIKMTPNGELYLTAWVPVVNGRAVEAFPFPDKETAVLKAASMLELAGIDGKVGAKFIEGTFTLESLEQFVSPEDLRL